MDKPTCYECDGPLVDHLCPECGVDEFGNPEDEIINCVFPHCGCDGARLCMAKEGASSRANRQNVESMWQPKRIRDPRERMRAKRAVLSLYGDVLKEGTHND